MNRPRYVIGIDGGGTKTAAMIANLDGDVLAEHAAGASNFQIIGVREASQTIFSLLKVCCSSVRCRLHDVRAVTIGLTGAGRAADQKRMRDGLLAFVSTKRKRLRNVAVESDARIALEGAFKGGAGIILIAGTGSIAFGKDVKGHVHRVGGWGRVLGDEGSGYAVGRAGLAAVTRHFDGRSEPTSLTRLLSRRFRLSTAADIIAAVYNQNFDIAAVAPLVFEAADKGDRICRRIVHQAASELTVHVRALAEKILVTRRSKVITRVPLSFIGGLVATDTLLSRLLREQISTLLPQIEIIQPMAPPAYGAVLMSLS